MLTPESPAAAPELRADLRRIAEWITPQSRVLDLGCGDGDLLHYLTEQRQVKGWGIEVDEEKIVSCISRGVNVVQADLDEPDALQRFPDGSFDYVVMTLALQAVVRPDLMLSELLRVGKQGIVTLPNFGHWQSRLQLLAGRMPVTKTLKKTWYETDNIHLCTVADFEALCAERDVKIVEESMVAAHRPLGNGLAQWRPNLFSDTAQYLLEKR